MEYENASLVILAMLVTFGIGFFFYRQKELQVRAIIETYCPPQLIHIILTENLHKNKSLWEQRRGGLQEMYGLDIIENAYSAVQLGVAFFFDEKNGRHFIVKYNNGAIKAWTTQEAFPHTTQTSKTPQ